MVRLPKVSFKALLVEDQMICARMLELYLDELGILVDTVGTGDEAMRALSQNTYDIIFMDIGLPDKNGIELTKEIRTVLGLDMPILGMTSHVFESAKEICIKAGMQDVFFKPVFQDTLSKTLSFYLMEFSRCESA